MSFLAVVPARGGSKGLRRKNLRRISGLSLTARAIKIARAVCEIDFVLLSTDCMDIAREGLAYGARVPFLRPAELSRDETPMIAVLRHAVGWFRKEMPKAAACCEGLVLLQPTSPMRSVEHVQRAIKIFASFKEEGNPVDCIHCVSPVPDFYQPERLYRMNRDGVLMQNTPRASDDRLVYRNGAAVILDLDKLDTLTIKGRTLGMIIEDRLISIDSYLDLKQADLLMSTIHLDGDHEPNG
jgi:CMP-N,N'-diacetyllegionaminic acid synthase